MLLLYTIVVLFSAYTILLLYYWWQWKNIPEFKPAAATPAVPFTVVIPARNEAGNIGALLEAVNAQDYPAALRQVIVVDDHSEDDTAALARRFSSVEVIVSGEAMVAFKKKAIETGIRAAKNDWILATDADCVPGKNWMSAIAAFTAQHNSVFIAAPVVISNKPSLLGFFQAMDFMMLQAITGAVVHNRSMSMCNGANIAYQKNAFDAVQGFSGIDNIASGDDMLLMYKIQQQFPGRVHYIKSKDAIVSTAPAGSWKAFFSQRIRWASKARQYQDQRILPVLVLVYLVNLSFLFVALAAIADPSFLWWLGGMWLAKTLIESPLYISAAVFFNKKQTIPVFIFLQPLHILYTIISGTFSQFGKYEWKGRKLK